MRVLAVTLAALSLALWTLGAHAQTWGHFKPIAIELLPAEQREIDDVTVKDGKVTAKEIPIDFWGFSLKPDSLNVEKVYQYPIAEPPLLPGDRFLRVRSRVVDDQSEVFNLLGPPENESSPAIVERTLSDGTTVQIRTKIHRANSVLFNQIVKGDRKPEPPRLIVSSPWSWGVLGRAKLKKIATLDDGRDLFQIESKALGRDPVHAILIGFEGDQWKAIKEMERDATETITDTLCMIGEDREVQLDGKNLKVGVLINISN